VQSYDDDLAFYSVELFDWFMGDHSFNIYVRTKAIRKKSFLLIWFNVVFECASAFRVSGAAAIERHLIRTGALSQAAS